MSSCNLTKDIEVVYETYQRGDIVFVNTSIFYSQNYKPGEEIGIILYSYEKDYSYNSCYEVFVRNKIITVYHNEIRKFIANEKR